MAQDVGVHRRAVGVQRHRQLTPRVRMFASAPNETIRAMPAPFARFQPRELRIVAVEHQHAAIGSTPSKISALASAIASMPAKNSRCTGSTVVMTSATVRPHHLHQRRDLAGMVHADLEDRKAHARRAARQRQRHAPVIVEGGRRGMGLALRARARGAAPPWSRSCRPSRSPRITCAAEARARDARASAHEAVEHVVRRPAAARHAGEFVGRSSRGPDHRESRAPAFSARSTKLDDPSLRRRP